MSGSAIGSNKLLDQALAAKQRSMQSLRLSTQSESRHEVDLQAQYALTRAIKLSTTLALSRGAVRIPRHLTDRLTANKAACGLAHSDVAAFDRRHERLGLDGLVDTLAAIQQVSEQMAPALQHVQGAMAADGGGRAAADAEELERREMRALQARKANLQQELAQLRKKSR